VPEADDDSAMSVASSTSINSAIRKYIRGDLPDEAINDAAASGKENPFQSKSMSP
tara:strand:+ start:604 stop:768 length:165 start_codon:yes stop_codon:yes gene_type:complete